MLRRGTLRRPSQRDTIMSRRIVSLHLAALECAKKKKGKSRCLLNSCAWKPSFVLTTGQRNWWGKSRLSPEACFHSLLELDVCARWAHASVRSVRRPVEGWISSVVSGRDTSRNWWQWCWALPAATASHQIASSWFSLMTAVWNCSSFPFEKRSFEIRRGRLLHQRSVDHRLAQEVWHCGDCLPLQEARRRTRVSGGAGSDHWKPGGHGNQERFILLCAL